MTAVLSADRVTRFAIVKHDDHRGAVRLTIRGDVDVATAATVAEFIGNALTCGRLRTLVVDLTEVPFLDAAGVRALLDGYLLGCARHVRVRVAGARELVRRVLVLTGGWDVLADQDPST